MQMTAQSTTQWAEDNFRSCQLGDKRRNNRLIHMAEQVASNPAASLPGQTETWSDLKGAYNLFNRPEVTFKAIAKPHWERTKQRTAGRYLVIGDTTEIDFGKRKMISGLGPTGNGSGAGFLLHNALLVGAETEEIVGIAGQTIHYRSIKPKKKESRTQRLKRKRESQVWGKVIDQVGPPPENVEWVHVLDRGGDNFEVYCHLLQQRSEWVVRAAKLNRYVLAGDDEVRMKLSEYLPKLDVLGTYTLSLRARPDQAAREAKLEVRVGKIKMPRPHHVSPWVKGLNQPPIAMNVVEVVEVDAPQGATPIRSLAADFVAGENLRRSVGRDRLLRIALAGRGISQGLEDRLSRGEAAVEDGREIGSDGRPDECRRGSPASPEVVGPHQSRRSREARGAESVAHDAQSGA